MKERVIRVKFVPDHLSSNGRKLISTMEKQNPWCKKTLDQGKAILWSANPYRVGNLRIQLVDTLSPRERILRFGVKDLDPLYWSGKVGETGGPIPTEAYVDYLVDWVDQTYGEGNRNCFWVAPDMIANAAARRQITGTKAINLAGDALAAFLSDSTYTISNDVTLPTDLESLMDIMGDAVSTFTMPIPCH